MNKGLTVVSLFDGMSCGFQVLKNLGIKVDKYYAFEIDKYAIQIPKKNHPEIIHFNFSLTCNFYLK
jgi:site-specific DNA-cytosine methylase